MASRVADQKGQDAVSRRLLNGVSVSFLRALKHWAVAINQPVPLAGLMQLPRYLNSWRKYARLAGRNTPRLIDSYPCLLERVRETPFDPHYFFQGAWLARRLSAARPVEHVDVGSSVLTISVTSAIVPTLFVDYRPLRTKLSGMQSVGGNLTRLPFGTDSLRSLSCLHVLEHVGLGRYGDPLDPDGSRKAGAELARVLSPGGRLYLSVPVGRERVCFNAHRVFNPETVVQTFGGLALVHFSLIDDQGQFIPDASHSAAALCEYGCGLFEFTKRDGRGA